MTATPIPERARILLALDACGISAELMEHVVAMAARMQADVDGLFVEDEGLLRAAALPFVREVATTGRERVLEIRQVQAASDEAAAVASRLLAELAARRQVRWSFSSRSGLRLRAALEAGTDADVLLPARRLPMAGAPFARVSLLADDSPQAERALGVVRALAVNGHVREVLLVSRAARPARAHRQLAELGLRVYVQGGGADEPATLLREMSGASADGLVIVPRHLVETAVAVHSGVIDTLRSALLLLR